MEGEIVRLTPNKVFSIAEVRKILPLIIKITKDAQREVAQLLNQLEAVRLFNLARAHQIEAQVDSVFLKWKEKLKKLGVHPKGMWLADFDNGEGYYCWKFPETEIKFSHGYMDGFSSRKAVVHTIKL
jgi:hypothetical protein